MDDLSHLHAIEARLFREQQRLSAAHNENEKLFRQTQINQAKKELQSEKAFLAKKGIVIYDAIEMTDDELLAELEA